MSNTVHASDSIGVPVEYIEGWFDGRIIMADEIVTRLAETFGDGHTDSDVFSLVVGIVQSIALPLASPANPVG
jgi:hypothetical protein